MKPTTNDEHNLITAVSGVKPDPRNVLGRVRLVVQDGVARYGSQNALGAALGFSGPAIGRWLKEDALEPGSAVLEAITGVLGVNGHWLLTGDGDRYTLPQGGGDELRQAGFESGLGAAEAAIAALRPQRGIPTPAAPEQKFTPAGRGKKKKQRPA